MTLMNHSNLIHRRRNISDFVRAELALQAEPLIAARAKEQQIRKPESVLANLPEQTPINTRDELATMSGVSVELLIAEKW